jgi:hypothetical protein
MEAASPLPPQESYMTPETNPHHARRWAILAVLGIAQLMVVLDGLRPAAATPLPRPAPTPDQLDRVLRKPR